MLALQSIHFKLIFILSPIFSWLLFFISSDLFFILLCFLLFCRLHFAPFLFHRYPYRSDSDRYISPTIRSQGFHDFAEFTAAVVGTVDSGLNSVVLANNNEMVLLPINEPTYGTNRKSQIQTYLEQNNVSCAWLSFPSNSLTAVRLITCVTHKINSYKKYCTWSIRGRAFSTWPCSPRTYSPL